MDTIDSAGKCQRTSPVSQIVDLANTRCELACIEQEDFRQPIAVTVWDNRAGDISKRYELRPDGTIKPAKAKAVLYEAMAYRAECQDLAGLSELLDVLPPNAALSNGLFAEPVARVTTLSRTKAGGEKVSRSRAHMRWRAEAGAVAFDVDIQAGREEVDGLPITPRTMDALLCKHVRWWAGIDRLYRYSPSSGIADLKGNILKPLKNFRIFIAVDDMTKTEALGAKIHAALHEAGHGWIELAANGNMLDRTLIDPCMYRPEHLIYVNPSLGAGLKHIASESLLIRGELDRLEVAGKGLSCTIAEWRRSSQAYKALAEAKRPEQRAFVERLKEQARVEARAKGEPEEPAAVRVGQVADHWLPPEFEVCLEDGKVVTCRELLEHPDEYDGKRCYEPSDWAYRDEDPRIGLVYLKNGLAQIYSHAHGGTRYFLQPLPLPASAFDEFPPLAAEEEAAVAKIRERSAGATSGRGGTRGAEAAVLDELNAKHAFVMIEGQAMVINDHGKGKFTYSREKDFVAKYANRFLPPLSEDDEPFPIAKYWWRHEHRKQYDGIEFKIGAPTPSYFNLWRGFAFEPSESGSCGLFWDYVRLVVCDGCAERFRWVSAWLAHIVQKPEEKPGVALVLRGLKGSGKSFLGDVLRSLVPNNSAILSKPDDLLGTFNAHLQNALLVQVEEAFWAGNKTAEGHLKTLITSQTIGVTPKYVNRYEVSSYSRFLITSNAGWVVPASMDERRFTVMDVSSAHRRDRAYFGAVWAQLHAGGLARMLHDLKTWKIEADPTKILATDGLFEQVVESFHPAERFVWEALKAGALPGGSPGFDDVPAWPEDGSEGSASCEDVYAAFRRFEKDYSRHATTSDSFGRKLRQLIPGVSKRRLGPRGEQRYHYFFPGLSNAREGFSAQQDGRIIWDDCDEELEI